MKYTIQLKLVALQFASTVIYASAQQKIKYIKVTESFV